MLPQTITIEKGAPLTRVVAVMSALVQEQALEIAIKKAKRKRTESQNAKLWAIYSEILRVGGESLAGWTKDDLHEHFLEEHFGTEIKELFGKKRRCPLSRSSKLSTKEFADFVEFIFRYMAERGVYIP